MGPVEVVPPKRSAPLEGSGERAWLVRAGGGVVAVSDVAESGAEEPPGSSIMPTAGTWPGRSFQLLVPVQLLRLRYSA